MTSRRFRLRIHDSAYQGFESPTAVTYLDPDFLLRQGWIRPVQSVPVDWEDSDASPRCSKSPVGFIARGIVPRKAP